MLVASFVLDRVAVSVIFSPSYSANTVSNSSLANSMGFPYDTGTLSSATLALGEFVQADNVTEQISTSRNIVFFRVPPPYGVGHWDKLSQSTVYELNLAAVVFDNQICHIFSNSMGFKKFMFPKIDCCGIGFSVWQNTIAIVVAAPVCGKENMSVHFF